MKREEQSHEEQKAQGAGQRLRRRLVIPAVLAVTVAAGAIASCGTQPQPSEATSEQVADASAPDVPDQPVA